MAKHKIRRAWTRAHLPQAQATRMALMVAALTAGIATVGALGSAPVATPPVSAPTPTVAAPVAAPSVDQPVTIGPNDIVARVTRVVDGDTVEATDPKGARLKVRILGIDTPETKDPRKPVQCWGPEATTFATGMLSQVEVLLVADATQELRDRYGRVLAHIVFNSPGGTHHGESYAVLAARAGAARAFTYDKPVTGQDKIVAAQQEARDAKRGLWGPPCNGSTDRPDTPVIE